MKSSRWLNHFSFLAFAFILLNVMFAFAGPSRTTYQAKIVKPDGYPLEASSINFKFTILDPTGSCILYSESYASVNMANTGGLISFSLGSGVKSFPVSGTTFEQVFSNITPNMGCDTGGGPPAVYTPLANDARKIVMQFNDGSGWQTLPAMNINAVPYAMYANDAMKFNGMAASEFVQVSTIPTCAASEALRYTGSGFQCLAVGGGVTSGSVITALGYTPANSTSFTSVVADVSSVSSTVFSVSSTVTSLQNSIAASLAAITSSQWTAAASGIYYDLGYVGIGTSAPTAALEINAPTATAFTTQFKVADGVTGGYFAVTEGTSTLSRYLPMFEYSSASVSGYGGALVGKIPPAYDLQAALGAAIVIDGRTTSNTTLSNANLLVVRNYTTPTFVVQASGTVGIGTSTPVTKLDVSGGIRIGLESATCTADLAGTLRYSSGVVEYCNGTTWAAFGVSGAGILAINGLTSGSQTIAFGNSGTTPNVSSVGTIHTFNFPQASVATTTAGLISYSDYLNFSNKQAATSAAIAATLGYTPADAVSVTTLSSTVGSVSSSVNSVSSSVASLQNSVAASFGAITSSQWTTSGTNIFYSTGNVGIGTSAPTGRIDLQTSVSNTLLYHINSSLTHTTTVSGGHNLVGVHSWLKPHVNGGATNLSTAYGVANRNVRNTTGGVDDNGVLNAMFGEHISFGHSNVGGASPTTLSMTGLYLDPQLGAGTINTFTALRLASPSTTGANVISRWGLAQDDTLARNYFLGNLGLGVTGPTARLHITAGTSSVAPVRFTAGTLLTPVQSGAMEYDGSNFYLTDDSGNRRVIAAGSASGTVDNATNLNSASNITMTPTSSVIVSSTLTSTSSGTGALVVKGGVGIGGNLNVAGTVSSSAQVLATGFRADPGSPNNANNSTNGYAFSADGDTGLFSPGTGIVSLYNDNSESLRVLANGNIGMGTSAPTTALEVNGDITTTGGPAGLSLKAGISDHAYISYFARTATPNSRTAYVGFPTGGSNNFNIYNEVSSSSPIVFGTGNVERARITSAGVGIGLTVPAYPLHVSGTIFADLAPTYTANGTYTDTGISVEANGKISAGITNSGQQIGINVVNLRNYLVTADAGTLSSLSGQIINYGHSNSNAVSPTTGSAVGLTIQPTRKSGSITNMLDLYIPADDGSSTVANRFSIYQDNGATNFFSGSVGIGLNNPPEKLSVMDSKPTSAVVAIQNTSVSGYSAINTYASTGALAGTMGYGNSASLVPNLFFISAPTGLAVLTNGTERMRVVSGGNIGIGTATPAQALDVVGDIKFGSDSLRHGNLKSVGSGLAPVPNGSAFGAILEGANAGHLLLDLRNNETTDGITFRYSASSTQVADTIGMVMTGAGRVGIGTASPSYKVQINGSSVANGNAQTNVSAFVNNGLNIQGSISNASQDAITYQSGGSGGGAAIAFRRGGSYDTYIDFYTNTAATSGAITRQMTLSNSGYFGIGTSSPTLPLDVVQSSGYLRSQTSDGGLEIGSGNDDSSYIDFHGNNNLNADYVGRIEYEDNSGMAFNVAGNAAPSLFIASATGYVGIGTTAPVAKLSVYTNNPGGYTIISNRNAGAGGQDWRWYSSSTGAPLGADSMCFGTGVCYFNLYTTGNATLTGTLTQNSDVRFKRDIASIPDALSAVSKLDGVTYYWKNPEKDPRRQIGLIAQEVEKVFPDAVATDATGYKSVAYQNLIAPVINAIKEIREWMFKTDERILVLEEARKQDKAAMDDLKKQNETLKAYLCAKDPTAPICK